MSPPCRTVPDKLLDLDDRLWDRDNQRVSEAQQEHRPAVSAELADQQTPTELKATLHAALKVLHGPNAQLPEVARVRAYASDAESPIEDLAVRAVSDLLEALLMWPASYQRIM